jgi:hypothetical protein
MKRKPKTDKTSQMLLNFERDWRPLNCRLPTLEELERIGHEEQRRLARGEPMPRKQRRLTTTERRWAMGSE